MPYIALSNAYIMGEVEWGVIGQVSNVHLFKLYRQQQQQPWR